MRDAIHCHHISRLLPFCLAEKKLKELTLLRKWGMKRNKVCAPTRVQMGSNGIWPYASGLCGIFFPQKVWTNLHAHLALPFIQLDGK
jgi:hypothetical protein